MAVDGKYKFDPDDSLEGILERFRVVAADMQSAYYQLEQELFAERNEPWESPPAPKYESPLNLAPLYLVGSLVGSLSKASIVINQHLEIVSINDAGRTDLMLKSITKIETVLDPASIAMIQNLLDSAESRRDVEITLINGKLAGIFDCVFLDNPIEKGRLLMLVAADVDIQHLRAAEDQLLRNLTSTLVHEIRTPLTSMQGFTELLLQVQNLEQKDTDKINVIRVGIDRLNLLASALGTVTHDAFEPQWQKLEIPGFLRGIADQFQSENSIPEEVVQISGSNDAFIVVTDPELLQKALSHLLNNAWEACAETEIEAINFRWEQTESGAIITIENQIGEITGPSPDEWWVPFYTTRSGHLGLGLVELSRIVEVLGGKAEISLGNGTVQARVILPS